MSHVEAPFIIAVIREKEKRFLGEPEMVRIMHATSLAEAREVLLSTPYALYLAGDASLSDGLTQYLESEFLWLQQSLDNANVVAFLAARYDALHCAQAVIALATGQPHVSAISRIGTLSHNTLQAMVFTDGYIPTKSTQYWFTCIHRQREAIAAGTWSMPFLFESMQHALEDYLEALATTSFMKALSSLVRERHISDMAFRNNLGQVDPARYEREWDAKAATLARDLRFEPVGYDPIVAYWITREMEYKTIRLLFAARAGGFAKQETLSLIRPFAHV